MLGYSTNDDPNGQVLPEATNRAWGAWAKSMRALRKLAKQPTLCLLTTNPKNVAGKNLGASDAERRSFNAEFTGLPDVVKVEGYDTLVTGARNANGQDEYKSGYSSDNVHLNDVGYDAQAPAPEAVLKTL